MCSSAIPSANSQLFETYNLVEEGDVLDTIDDDDDIRTTKLLAMIRFEGSVSFQAKLRKLCEEYIDVFSTKVRLQFAKAEPMSILSP